jgi:hypothetical protein
MSDYQLLHRYEQFNVLARLYTKILQYVCDHTVQIRKLFYTSQKNVII